MKLDTSTFFKKAKFASLAIIIGLTVGYATADWTPPGQAAPGCPSSDPACNPPLNVSSAAQTKLGGLIINEGNAGLGLLVPFGKVGFGITNAATMDATARVDIDGQIRIRGGNPGAGKVLVSDANGLASWGAGTGGFASYYTKSGVMDKQSTTAVDVERCNNSGGDHECETVDCKPNDNTSLGKCVWKTFDGRRSNYGEILCNQGDVAISATASNTKVKGKLFSVEPIIVNNIPVGYRCVDISKTGGSCTVLCAAV